MKKSVFRLLVVVAWSAILLLALYWPKIQVQELEENSFTIFTWGDILEPSVITAFEKETGIKIYLNYYSSNEELLVKLKATQAEGFDLIIPSDYAVRSLIREGLLQPLDRSKLDFFATLNPLLLHHTFDPKNDYSLPFSWEVFGLGIDRDYFAAHPFLPSWKLIFDKSLINYRIGMVNDPIEAVQFASFYLFGPDQLTLDTDKQQEILQLLSTQRSWVEVYASFRADYLLATRNCPVVLASSSYLLRTMRTFPFVQFIIPQEGTFITIENLCIPAASRKQSLVYRFMNFLYTPESAASHFATYGIFPAVLPSQASSKDWRSSPDIQNNPHLDTLLHASPEEFHHYHFFHNDLMPEAEVRNLWVEVKTN